MKMMKEDDSIVRRFVRSRTGNLLLVAFVHALHSVTKRHFFQPILSYESVRTRGDLNAAGPEHSIGGEGSHEQTTTFREIQSG